MFFVRILEILMRSHASELRHVRRGAEDPDWPLGIPSLFTRFETFYLHLLSVKTLHVGAGSPLFLPLLSLISRACS